MVHLSPATVDEFENSCRANVQRLYGFAIVVGAAFPPHGPKHLPGTMNRIVPEFHVNVRRALEDPLIHLVRLIRSAPNPAERVINRDFIGLAEIIVDQRLANSKSPSPGHPLPAVNGHHIETVTYHSRHCDLS